MSLRNRIIWHFGHGLHSKKRFSGRYEVVMWYTKTDNYVFNLDLLEFLLSILERDILKDQTRESYRETH